MTKLPGNQSIIKDVGFTLLKEGKSIRIKAHGYSMFPCIKPGSLLLIEPINVKGAPRRGEIVAIRREGGLIVHRLSGVMSKGGVDFYIARGDSNAFADDPVKINMIIGRIVRAETTGENPVVADIRINEKPYYFINRLRVIYLLTKNKIKPVLRGAKMSKWSLSK